MTSIIWASHPLKIDLKKAVALTVEKNLDIQNAKASRVSQKYALRASQYEFELQNTLTGETTVLDSDKDTTIKNSTTLSPIASIKNKFGTEFEFSPHISLQDGFEPTVAIRQPLIRGFGTQVVLSDLRSAEQQNDIDRLGYIQTISSAISDTIVNYIKVISSQYKIRALKRSLINNRLNLEQAKINFQFGQVAKSDINDQRMQVANTLSDIASGEAEYQNNLNQLKQSINISNQDLILKDEVESIRSNMRIPSKEEALAAMTKNNNKLKTLQHTLFQSQQSYIKAKNDLRIELNVVGTKQLFHSTDDSNLVVELDVPINNVTKKQALVDAKTNIIQAKQNIQAQQTSIQNQANNLVKELDLLNISVQAQHEQVKLRNQRLAIDQHRLEKGYVSAFEVNERIKDRDEEIERLQELEIDFSTKLISLYKEMGKTLDHWHVKLPKNY